MKLLNSLLAFFAAISCSACIGSAAAADNEKSITVRGGKLSIVGDWQNQRIFLNKKALPLPNNFFTSGSFGFVRNFPYDDKDIVLVVDNSVGAGCPVQYFFIEIASKGSAGLTKHFGTCAPLKNIIQKGSTIAITMPDWAAANPDVKGTVKYTYTNGMVSENGKPMQ